MIQETLDRLSFVPDIHAVGGAVRDHVIGREAEDVDVASPVRPNKFQTMCKKHGLETVPVGIDHGTVMVVFEDAPNVEHTTFRKDMATDGRHATVEFADTFYEDSLRRDFTINAMGMKPDGTIVDPHGGQEDIEDRTIQTVGDPEKRFKEDYLRILRLARFSGRYQLQIDTETGLAATELANRVAGNVSVERITQEFNKAFDDPHPSFFVRILHHTGVLQQVLPEISCMKGLEQDPQYHPEGDVFEHTMNVLDRAPSTSIGGWKHLRWAALLHDVGKVPTAELAEEGRWFTFHGHEKEGAEMIPEIGSRLRWPNWMSRRIKKMTRHHMYPLHIASELEDGEVPDRLRRRFQSKVGDILGDMEALCKADAKHRRPEGVWGLFEPLEEPPERVLTGYDLIEEGHEPGPQFGPMLEAAHEHQIGTGCRDEDELLKVAIEARP